MKTTLLSLLILAQFTAYAQWTSGGGITYTTDKVGIGTNTPSKYFEVRINHSSHVAHFSNDHPTGYGLYLRASVDPLRIVPNTSAQGTQHLFVVSGSTNVGIGVSSPAHKLDVNGTIHSKEVLVDTSFPAPDYVFAKDYKLPTIEQLKRYIDENHHLPEVPSAKEIEANGIQLGEMNMLLLKKIEELTLYVIELKSELDEVKKKVN